MPALSPLTKAIVRQQALRAMCFGPDGRLTKNARLIVAYLQRECNGAGQYPPPKGVDNVIDPVALGIQIGKRQVFDTLAKMLALDLSERLNLRDEID